MSNQPKMRIAAVALAMVLGSCGPDAPPAADSAPASFAENPYAFCMTRDENWLRDLLARIDAALPGEFTRGSVAYESLHVQDRMDGKAGTRELQIRFDALRNGERAAMSAYGAIDPASCAVGKIDAQTGVNRFDETAVRFTAP